LRVWSTGDGGSLAQRRSWWWEAAARLSDKLQQHNAALLAGGIAMYGLLSVFPGLAAAVSLYGLFATPGEAVQQMQAFAGVLPQEAWQILSTQLQSIAAHDHGTLTAAAALGLLIALWSARLTMSAVMTATNIAFETADKRSYLRQILVSLLLTVAAIIGFIAMLLLGVVVPLLLGVLGTSRWVQGSVMVLRWLLLWGFAVLGLEMVYRYAPAREARRWRWVSWGSALAATGWLAISGLFAIYVRTIAGYDRTYGALGGVVVLLMWFYFLSLIVILGAEINAVLERQRRAQRRALGRAIA
jgi:membrane protein